MPIFREPGVAAAFDPHSLFVNPSATDPVLDNQGDPLTEGSWYYNTTDLAIKVYNGTTWDYAVDSAEMTYNVGLLNAVTRAISNRLSDFVSAFDFIPVAEQAAIKAGTSTYNCTTDVQNAINALAEGQSLWFPNGVYPFTTGLVLNGKSNIRLYGDSGVFFRFTQGAYIGIDVQANSERVRIEGLKIYGVTTTTPTLTALVKIGGNSPNNWVCNNEFGYGVIGVLYTQTYINKCTNNDFSNCYTYIECNTSEGTNLDTFISGNTFGTVSERTTGTQPTLKIGGNQNKVVDNYFETQVTAARYSIEIPASTQDILVACNQFYDSGGIIVSGVSARGTINSNGFYDCDNNTPSYIIRIGSSSTFNVIGNYIDSVSAVVSQAVSMSGAGLITGNRVRRAVTGIQVSGSALVGDNFLQSCTTGINFASGASGCRLGINVFEACTTNVGNPAAISLSPGFQRGTAALPGVAFDSDDNNGWWSPSADTQAWSTAGVERMRLDSSSFRAGTTVATGEAINTFPIIAGVIKNCSGTVATTTGVAVNAVILPDVPYSSWLITAAVENVDDAPNYTELAMVVTNGSSAVIATSINAALLSITLSGLNVQVTQTSGSNQTVSWTATRVA